MILLRVDPRFDSIRGDRPEHATRPLNPLGPYEIIALIGSGGMG